MKQAIILVLIIVAMMGILIGASALWLTHPSGLFCAGGLPQNCSTEECIYAPSAYEDIAANCDGSGTIKIASECTEVAPSNPCECPPTCSFECNWKDATPEEINQTLELFGVIPILPCRG